LEKLRHSFCRSKLIRVELQRGPSAGGAHAIAVPSGGILSAS